MKTDSPSARERTAFRLVLGGLAALTLFAVVAVALGGCLPELPMTVAPMCQTSADCDPGETCDEGICWGNPPDLSLAAVLYPPEGRPDLGLSEVTSLEVAPDGTLVNADFAATVEVKGRVVMVNDPSVSIAARIVFRRDSFIAGGPAFAVTATSQPGQQQGSASFSVRLQPGEYDVGIYPDDGTLVPPTQGQPTAAELAPPSREYRAIHEDQTLDLTLGDAAGVKYIRGRVVDAIGNGIAGMRVRAWGRFLADPAVPLEPASTLARTAEDGSFMISMPRAWDDQFDLHVTPKAGDALPTLVRKAFEVADPPPGPTTLAADIGDVRMPSFPLAVPFTLPVKGWSGSGGLVGAAGATVTFRHTFSAGLDELTYATYETTATVDADGNAAASLIPAVLDTSQPESVREYAVDVVPPTDSELAAAWSVSLQVGFVGGVLPQLELERRVTVTGTLLDAEGTQADGVTVRAEASYPYLTSLPSESQERIATLARPQAVVKSGIFVLAVDPQLCAGCPPAVYDLELVPPSSSLLPRWSRDELAVEGAVSGSLEVGEIRLPHASYARGIVRTPTGDPVEGAEIRVYVLADSEDVCASLVGVPCQPPARLTALAKSDAQGELRLTLPSP